MKNNKVKLLIITVTIILLIVTSFFLILVFRNDLFINLIENKTNPVVTLTKSGYKPKFLIVKKNTQVIFKSNSTKFFWPASDVHPYHYIYPEFDAKNLVPGSSSWSFNFNKVGFWNFHDHLYPSFKGSIIVLDNNPMVSVGDGVKSFILSINIFGAKNSFNYEKLLSDCKKLEKDKRLQCWEKAAITIVDRYGVEKSLDFLTDAANKDLEFAANCHVYFHRIGEEAFQQLIKHQNFSITSNSSACNMGFYHGFLQEFVSHGRDWSKAKEFCEHVGTDTKKLQVPKNMQPQCYHGIGHGLVYQYAATYWGQENTIIEKSIEDCNRLTDNKSECVNGVFGGIALMYFGLHGFQLNMDLNNPFKICDGRRSDYQVMCYDALIPPLYGKLNLNFDKVGPYILKINDNEVARVAMEHLASMPAHTMVPESADLSIMITKCRQFPENLKLDCIKGFSGILMVIGSFEQSEKRSLDFCRLPQFSEKEREYCFSGLIQQSDYSLTEDKTRHLCSLIDKPFNKICDHYLK